MPYRVTADPRQEAQPADDSELGVDFMDAIGADVAPLEGHDVFGVAAEDAGRLVFFEDQHVILNENFQRIPIPDFQYAALFYGQHDAAQIVDLSNNPC